MKINILSLGKFKINQEYKSIFEYYKKRLRVKINLIEVKTFSTEKKKELEKAEILKFIKEDDHVITLDRNGENLSSIKFSEVIDQKLNCGCKRLNFVIGSEEGLDDFFINSFTNLSFGNQTWPHLLVRVMLIEQIYRAFEIIKNSQYHK